MSHGTQMQYTRYGWTVFAGLLLLCPPALAHDTAGAGSFGAALLHPLGGIDHVLLAVAVGLWAAIQARRSAGWVLPAVFLGGTGAGITLVHVAGPVVGIEVLLTSSVILLGIAVARRAAMPVAATLLIAAGCGLTHGLSHDFAPGVAGPFTFGVGMMLGTGLAHMTAFAVALAALRLRAESLLTGAGWSLAGTAALVAVAA